MVCGCSQYQERVSPDTHSRMAASVFFALPAVLASEVGYMEKTIDQKRLAPDSLSVFLSLHASNGSFLGTVFFCQDVTDHCTLTESADSLSLFVVTTPHHRCSVADMAWDPLASSWSYADIFLVLARGANCTNVHLARLIAGVKESRSRFSVIKCLQPNRIAVEQATGYHVFAQSRGRSLRAVALAARRWSSSMVTRLQVRECVFFFLVSGEAVVNCASGAKSFWRNLNVFFAGLTSASVWMHRKGLRVGGS